MNIKKFEQSGFIFETSAGFKLAVDIGAYTPLEKLEGISPDAMLVSHIHGDHFTIPQIKKLSPKKLYLNDECIEAIGEQTLSSEITQVKIGDNIDINGIKVQFFEVNHGPNVTMKPKENFGFLIEMDGNKIYFGGDIFYPSGLDVKDLEVDYALLPVGGFYTFDPEKAFEFAKQFKKIGKIIPMHYENAPETKNQFISLAKEAFIVEENM